MKLVCNATTPKELREEIVSLILHRASFERDKINTTESIKQIAQYDYAAIVLANLAEEVKSMEIVNAWPSGLRESE